MFTTAQELEDRWGSVRFVQLLDLDNDGTADEEIVAIVVTDTNKEVEAHLVNKGFSHEQLEVLAKDETLRRCAADIGKELASYMKPEFLNPDGTSTYTVIADRARKRLTDIAMMTLRLPLERAEGAGKSEAVESQRVEVEPTFYVTPTKINPRGPGGF